MEISFWDGEVCTWKEEDELRWGLATGGMTAYKLPALDRVAIKC